MIASSVSMSGFAVAGAAVVRTALRRRKLGTVRLRNPGGEQVAGRDVLVAVGEHRDRRRGDHRARDVARERGGRLVHRHDVGHGSLRPWIRGPLGGIVPRIDDRQRGVMIRGIDHEWPAAIAVAAERRAACHGAGVVPDHVGRDREVRARRRISALHAGAFDRAVPRARIGGGIAVRGVKRLVRVDHPVHVDAVAQQLIDQAVRLEHAGRLVRQVHRDDEAAGRERVDVGAVDARIERAARVAGLTARARIVPARTMMRRARDDEQQSQEFHDSHSPAGA